MPALGAGMTHESSFTTWVNLYAAWYDTAQERRAAGQWNGKENATLIGYRRAAGPDLVPTA